MTGAAAGIAGVVLAAGLGTRLRPLTEILPKALCPIGNVPLVDLAVARLRRAGAATVAVNVHHHRDRMVEHLTALDPTLHLSIEEPDALGTAGALGKLRPWVDGRPTLVHNADAWFGDLPAALLDEWDPVGDRIRLVVVPARPGMADFDGWTFAGVSLLPWKAVEPLRAEPTGLWEVSWRNAWHEGRVDPVPLLGPWYDTGTPATYLAANLAASGGASVIDSEADVDPAAVVERSVVWAGATVAAGERLCEQIRAPRGITVDATQR